MTEIFLYMIKTLCLLNEKLNEVSQDKKTKEINIIEQSENENKFAKSLVNVLDVVQKELDQGKIIKRDLERFLNIKKIPKNIANETKKEKVLNNMSVLENDNNDKYVKEKLGLIALILGRDYIEENKHLEYEKIIKNINEKVVSLISTKDSLMIFHRNKYIDDIKKIAKIIDEIENSPIANFKNNETSKSLDDLNSTHSDLCGKIYNKLDDLNTKFRDNPKDIEIIINGKTFVNIFKVIKEKFGRKEEKKI